MKTTKSILTRLILVFSIVFISIIGVWSLDIWNDKYPKTSNNRVGFLSNSELNLFLPSFRLECAHLHYYWRGITKDSPSEVEKYYQHNWQNANSTRKTDSFYVVPIIENNTTYIGRIYSFFPDYTNDTIIVIETNIYICKPRE